HVAGLPRNMTAVVHVVAVALEYIEHRAVEVAVLLPIGAGRIGLNVRLDRLRHRNGLRRDHALAVVAGPALPGHVLCRIDARRFEQRFVEMTVGAFERADKSPFLGPALPVLVSFSSPSSGGLLWPCPGIPSIRPVIVRSVDCSGNLPVRAKVHCRSFRAT